jgi:hypothetical protein
MGSIVVAYIFVYLPTGSSNLNRTAHAEYEQVTFAGGGREEAHSMSYRISI